MPARSSARPRGSGLTAYWQEQARSISSIRKSCAHRWAGRSTWRLPRPTIWRHGSARQKGRGVKVYAADMDGTAAEAWHPVAPSVLGVGNEGSGLSSDVAACVDERITIAKVNGGGRGVESLNVAQAASILGYLWTRRAT